MALIAFPTFTFISFHFTSPGSQNVLLKPYILSHIFPCLNTSNCFYDTYDKMINPEFVTWPILSQGPAWSGPHIHLSNLIWYCCLPYNYSYTDLLSILLAPNLFPPQDLHSCCPSVLNLWWEYVNQLLKNKKMSA